MDTNVAQYKDLFISESKERLQRLNNLLIDYEKKESKEALDGMMQEAHTLKGMAASMEYNKMAFLCHVLEDVFDYARNGMIVIIAKFQCIFTAHI